MLSISSAPTEDGGLLVAIEDTGTGLDPKIGRAHLRALLHHKAERHGMGLSICRSIIAAHGGRFWVQPRQPHGTAFRFTVPAKPPQALSA